MTGFAYGAATDPMAAITRAAEEPRAAFIAGGTDLMQLVQERIENPVELIDINGLPFDAIASTLDGMRIGALSRLADVADHPRIRQDYRVVAEALDGSASPMVRNMATLGGNLLQRTRCLYFRDSTTPCNKRAPGSGCSAQKGQNRINAILGGSTHCIATHASDLAVALVACDAEVIVAGPQGERTIRVEDLYRPPGDTPEIETVLEPGDLVTYLYLPIQAAGRHSRYVKVRDRASFEWSIASAAVSLGLHEGTVLEARIVAGGIATVPWRLPRLEEMLVGKRLDRDLAREVSERAADGAQPHGQNAYKIPLIKRTVERALIEAGGLA